MVKRNLIIADVETSGLDPEDGCEVVQIYARAINYWDLEDHANGSFHAYIKPRRPEKAQAGALKVIGEGWTKAQNEGLDPEVVWYQFFDWCHSINPTGKASDKPIMFAHNQDFDRKYIEFHGKENKVVKKSKFGWEYPWAWIFDSMGIAHFIFESDPDMENLKLDTVINKLGLKRANPDIHDAKEDVDLLTEFVKRAYKYSRACYKKMKITQ